MTTPTTTTTHRSSRYLPPALLAVAVFGLSGCLRIDANLTLGEDDTVSGTYLYAASTTTAEELGLSGEALAGQLGADILIDTLTNATATPYAEGDLSGLTITFTNEPLTTFDGIALNDEISIVRDGDDYVFDGPTLGDLTDDDAALLTDAGITLTITFPGTVTEHNGSLTGTTVTWDLTAATEAPHARGRAAAPGLPWVVIGASTALLATIGGLIWWRRHRGR